MKAKLLFLLLKFTCSDVRDQVANFLGVHLPQLVKSKVPLFELLQDFKSNARMLPQWGLKVPHLTLDRLG